MKVKILFFPVAVFVALVVGIWHIQPEIANVLELRRTLAAKEQTLQDIQQKARNVTLLASSLDAKNSIAADPRQSTETKVLEFLPQAQDHERVVDSLNALANEAGLAVVNVEFDPQATANAIAAEAARVLAEQEELALASQQSFASGDPSAVPQPVVAKPQLLPMPVKVLVQGSYDNIKSFSEKLYRMNHSRSLTGLNIVRDEQAPPDVLSATVAVTFHYYPKKHVLPDASLPVFARSQFDFGVVERLNTFVTSSVQPLEAPPAGRPNPFTP